MFRILGGDIPKNASYMSMFETTILVWGFGKDKQVDLKANIESVEAVTEENKKKFVGTVGWGLVGGLVLGPVGLLAGVLAGGNKKEVCVAIQLKDGRKILAVVDPKIYKNLLVMTM